MGGREGRRWTVLDGSGGSGRYGALPSWFCCGFGANGPGRMGGPAIGVSRRLLRKVVGLEREEGRS